MLVNHFIEKFATDLDRNIASVGDDVMNKLMEHDYPGNVRELENAIERAVALSRDEYITVDSLPPALSRQPRSEAPEISADGMNLDEVLADYERSILAQALRQTNSVKKRAAQLLGISFRSFRYRLEKLGLEDESPGSPFILLRSGAMALR